MDDERSGGRRAAWRWTGGLLLNAGFGCLLFLPLFMLGLAILIKLHVVQNDPWNDPLSLVVLFCVPAAAVILTIAYLANRALSRGLREYRLYWVLTTVLQAAPTCFVLVPDFALMFH